MPNDDPFGSPDQDPFDSSEDEFSVDLAGQGLMPAGKYTFRATDVTRSYSSTGNEMFVWQMTVAEGEFMGRSIPIYTALSPQALWKAAEVIEALGLGIGGSAVKFSKRDAIGRIAVGVVSTSEYDGRERNQIDRLEKHPKGSNYDPSDAFAHEPVEAAAKATKAK